MKIKTKVRIGVIFLFLIILTLGGTGIYYLNSLSQDSQRILLANYESLQHTKEIIGNCDSLVANYSTALASMESEILKQEQNVTEIGEQELTRDLRAAFENLKAEGASDAGVRRIRQLCIKIQDLNMQAIIRKSDISRNTSEKASTYLVLIASICGIIAFTFIVNFPGYVGDPIAQLTNSIKSIAEKNYEERLHFDRKDEFEELAKAFNQMAEKLDEYEHSNLAKVIFEKKRIETIINQMTDPVIGLDAANTIIFANQQATSILNLQQKDLIGKYAPDVALNNDLFRNLLKSQDGKGSGLIKAVIEGKENYFSKDSVAVSYLPTGELEKINIGSVILLKNVTSYKELDLAKTNFIATISHEIKTPIAALQMCAKLLQDQRVGMLNEEQNGILKTLNDELSRLSNITNELLDLSQVESGNIRLTIKETRPDEIVQLAVEAVKFQAERKNIKVQADVEKDLPDIQADIDKTTWVLVNFLTNALRYSPENDTILLSCKRENSYVQFSVQDNGPGIDKKYLPRIFERFFQVPGTSSGTGLGLAISREFIEAQGGTVDVKSEIGQGSTFIFNLSPNFLKP